MTCKKILIVMAVLGGVFFSCGKVQAAEADYQGTEFTIEGFGTS